MLEQYGLTREEADRSAWAIEPGGRRFEGAAAVNRVWWQVGGGWRLLAAAYRVRPVARIEDAAYAWFAGNRSRFGRFGVTPECDDPGARCGPG